MLEPNARQQLTKVGDTEFESKTAVEQNPIKHVFYELLAISRYAVSACKDMQEHVTGVPRCAKNRAGKPHARFTN